MKRKNKDGKQLTLFDEYHRALNQNEGSGTVDRSGRVVDFLSELREQRTLTGTLLTKSMDNVNLRNAFKQVKQNKGAPGVDGMSIEEAGEWLSANISNLRNSVLESTYEVQSVRSVEIPKANGGVRMLGIPTVLDRTIQQAIHQILCPLYDRHFSENSYGFRPNRDAQMAVRQVYPEVMLLQGE